MYERRGHPLLSRLEFLKRVGRHGLLAAAAVAGALGIGVAGYHFIARLDWIDSLLNASMILGGMGPVDPLHSAAAKVFASFYALFSGLMFIGIASVLLAPFVHRLLHRFHYGRAVGCRDDDIVDLRELIDAFPKTFCARRPAAQSNRSIQ